MSRAVAISVAAGLISALFTLSVLIGSLGAMILAYLAPLPVFAVGFMLGAPASLIATGAGALVVALASDWVPALAFVATTGAPCCLVVRQALLSRQNDGGSTEWYPPGPLLLWLAGYILALIAVVALIAGAMVGDIYAQLTGMLDQLASAEAGSPMAPYFEFLASAPVRDTFIKLLPGTMAASWLLLMVVNAVLAQGAVSALGKARRPNPRMADIELPLWASLVLIASLAASTQFTGFAGLAATSVTMAGLAVFLLAGLGIVHAIMANRPARIGVLAAMYIFLSVLFWPIFFLAGIAVLEPWTKLRRRLAAPPPGQS